MEEIEVVYEKGVFKPLKPVNLKVGEQVTFDPDFKRVDFLEVIALE